MVTAIILIVLTLLRIPSAIISGRNEARIKAQGGREYGQTHSRALIVVQFLIYVGKKRLFRSVSTSGKPLSFALARTCIRSTIAPSDKPRLRCRRARRFWAWRWARLGVPLRWLRGGPDRSNRAATR